MTSDWARPVVHWSIVAVSFSVRESARNRGYEDLFIAVASRDVSVNVSQRRPATLRLTKRSRNWQCLSRRYGQVEGVVAPLPRSASGVHQFRDMLVIAVGRLRSH